MSNTNLPTGTGNSYLAVFAPKKRFIDDFQYDCRSQMIEARTAFTEGGWETRVRERILPGCSCCVVLCLNGLCRLSGKDYSDLDCAARELHKMIIVVELNDNSEEYAVSSNDQPSDLLENAVRLRYDDESFWEKFKALPSVKEAVRNDEATLLSDRDARIDLAVPVFRVAFGLLQPSPNGVVNLSSFAEFSDEKIRQFIEEYYPASKKSTNVYVNELGMKFKRIKPGSFVMGNGLSDEELEKIYGGDLHDHCKVSDWVGDARPHEVRLTREFFVATYLTQVSVFADFVKATGYETTAEIKGEAWTLDHKDASVIGKVYKDETAHQYDSPLYSRNDSSKENAAGWSYRKNRNWREPGFHLTEQLATQLTNNLIDQLKGQEKGQEKVQKASNQKGKQTGMHPVVCVSYVDALAFIEWLNENYADDRYLLSCIVGEKKAGAKRLKYRLLTEAEYEYVIRGGTTTEFFWGDSHRDGYGYLNAADTSLVDAGYCFESRFSHDDGFPYTSPVGRFMKNPNGIYDAVGNVLSWTSDWYGTNYGLTEAELNTAQDDPTGPESGSYRVLRGAAWCSPPIGCRSATRYLRAPEFRSDYVGFRVAFEVVDAKDK